MGHNVDVGCTTREVNPGGVWIWTHLGMNRFTEVDSILLMTGREAASVFKA